MRGIIFYHYGDGNYIAGVARLGVERYKFIENVTTNSSIRANFEIDRSILSLSEKPDLSDNCQFSRFDRNVVSHARLLLFHRQDDGYSLSYHLT